MTLIRQGIIVTQRIISIFGLIYLWHSVVAATYNFENVKKIYKKYDDNSLEKISDELLGISVYELVNKKEFAKAKVLLNQALSKAHHVAQKAIIHAWLLKIDLKEGKIKDFEKHFTQIRAFPLLKNTDLAQEIYEAFPTAKRELLIKHLIELSYFDTQKESICPYFELEKRQKRAQFIYALDTRHNLPKKIQTQVLSELYVTLPEVIDEDKIKKIKNFGQFFKNINATDVVKRMELLLVFGKNKEARRSFSEFVPKHQKMSKLLYCELGFIDAKVDRKMRKYKTAIARFDSLARDCPESIAIKARYLSLMQKSQIGDHTSIPEFSQFVSDYPTHSFADDVLLFKAQILLEKNLTDEAQTVLSELIEKYPDGDMVDRALFLKAFLWAKANQTEKALLFFSKITGKFAPDTLPHAQAKYWHARLSLFPDVNDMIKPRASKAADAEKKSLFELAYGNSFTIYSWLAEILLSSINEKLKKPVDQKPPEDENLGEMPALLEPIAELIVNGFRTEALFLLDDILVNKNTIEMASYIAHFYVVLNRPEAGHQKLVRCDLELAYALSKKIPKTFNDISYPRPFPKEVAFALNKVDVPASVLYAVMRQESGFIKGARSFANALGLMQVMYSSALPESKAWQIDNLVEKDLLLPDVNILLGASILQKYWQRFGNLLAGLAAFNAGPTATNSWLAKNNGAAIDTFMESITYKETRDYLKSVGGAIRRYSLFDDVKGAPDILMVRKNTAQQTR